MKIICYSSYSSIWYFSFAEAIIAHALNNIGCDVVFITPGRDLIGRSNPMNESILRREFNLNGYAIGRVLTEKDRAQINDLTRNLTKDNFEKLIIDNINIGKIALYEFLLNHKRMSSRLEDNEWDECLIEIKNTLVSFFACRSIIKKEKPDRIIMYSALYSVNHVWAKYADMNNIPTYFIHHGTNLSDMDNTLIIAKNNSYYYVKKLKRIWSRLKNIPVNQEMLRYVTDHFIELIKANHTLVYSSPKSSKAISIRNIFHIEKNQKILTATMSSYDEFFAAEYIGTRVLVNDLIFDSQIDWIQSLINYVKIRKNLFLIIRVHPRDFPNKRDSVKSEHATKLESILYNLPNNVAVNWPAEGISIYDLAQETNVFLNAWSTVGIEMSLLGIPVVVYSKELILYPPELNYVASNLDEYYKKIQLALREGWKYSTIKKTYRWLSLLYCRTTVKLRKQKYAPTAKSSHNTVFVLSKYLSILPDSVSKPIKKLFSPSLEKYIISREREAECRRQMAVTIDITGVEQMLRNKDDTLVDLTSAKINTVTTEAEDRFIREELHRIYSAMYKNISEKSNIKNNSLRYNLKKYIT